MNNCNNNTNQELEDVFAELNSLVGMENVKSEVKNLVHSIKIHKENKEKGLDIDETINNLIFVGIQEQGKQQS